MSAKTKKTEAKQDVVNPESLTDEQIKELAKQRGLIKSSRSEGQVAFEEAVSRLNGLEAEIFDLLQQADFNGPVEVRFGVGRDGEKFLSAIRTRKEYAPRGSKKAKDKSKSKSKKA